MEEALLITMNVTYIIVSKDVKTDNKKLKE